MNINNGNNTGSSVNINPMQGALMAAGKRVGLEWLTKGYITKQNFDLTTSAISYGLSETIIKGFLEPYVRGKTNFPVAELHALNVGTRLIGEYGSNYVLKGNTNIDVKGTIKTAAIVELESLLLKPYM